MSKEEMLSQPASALYRIPLFKVFMAESVKAKVIETLYSGYIAMGENVKEFEQNLAKYIGNDHVVATNSCTSALKLALRLAGVGPGDEVVSSPQTCIATNIPVLELGAKLVWADIHPESGGIDPEDIKHAITGRTKAILFVDWAGDPADLNEINEIAGLNGIRTIEDAAHAFGAEYERRKVGNHCDYTCFSFQAIKQVTAGDGGAITIKDSEQFETAKKMRWYGIDRLAFRDERGEIRWDEDIAEWGYKANMNNIGATIVNENLKHADDLLQTARRNGAWYNEQLRDIPGIKILKRNPASNPSYWVYTLLAERRDALMASLTKSGVHASKVHVRNDKYSCFSQFKGRRLPGVDKFSEQYVSIPSGWWVSENDAQTIVELIKKGW